MSYTRAQLVTEAAKNLQLIAAGQSLETDDSDVIDGKVDALVDQLAADNVVEIDDLATIPSEYFIPLAELLANAAATSFGQQYSVEKKMAFEIQLRRSAASSPTYEVIKAEYF